MNENKVPFRALIVLLLVVTLASTAFFAKVHVVTSPSINHRFFWKVQGEAHKGDYVTLHLVNSLVEGGAADVTKRVGCVEGETLLLVDRTFYCNGSMLGTAKLQSLKGKPLPLFEFSGAVPHGMAFMVGDDKNSFDSRYWGFFDLSKPYQKLTPFRPFGI